MLPQEVVKNDRLSAWAIYGGLLTLFFIYVGLTVDNRVTAQDNPPRSITSLNKQWSLPHIAFCPLKNEVDTTISQPHDLITDAGYTAVVDPQFFDISEPIIAIQDPTNQNCAIFLTGGLTMKQKGVNQLFLAIHIRDVADSPSDFVIYAAEVRFYPPNGKWQNSSVNYIPYGTYESSFANSLTLTRSELRRLDGFVEETYSAVVSSNPSRNFDAEYVGCVSDDPCDSNKTHIVGSLININGWNVEYTKEINPVNVYELIGLFGGMWGYVSLIFGLLFVSGSHQDGDKIARWKAVVKQTQKAIINNSVLHAMQLSSDLAIVTDQEISTVRQFAAKVLDLFCAGNDLSCRDYENMLDILNKVGSSREEVMDELKKLNLDDLHTFLTEWMARMDPPIYSIRVIHVSDRMEWFVEFEEEVASIELADGSFKKKKTSSKRYAYSQSVINVLKRKEKKENEIRSDTAVWVRNVLNRSRSEIKEEL